MIPPPQIADFNEKEPRVIRPSIPAISFVFMLGLATGWVHAAAVEPATTSAATTSPSAVAQADQDTFDAAKYLTGDWAGIRTQLFSRGISIEPTLILDYSHEASGGFDPGGNSFRQRFDFPVTINTNRLFGLPGGTGYADLQVQNGGDPGTTLVGSAQNVAADTTANNRTQLGQIWYEQLLLDDQVRIRAGKIDGNSDFDVLQNAQEFIFDAFTTNQALGLMPSFPDNAFGVQIFLQPKTSSYWGFGVFDGSQARGVQTGSYGPSHFFDRLDNLFLITEAGQRYQVHLKKMTLPGRIGLGGWWDTNRFPHLDHTGTHSGTGGAYFVMDQALWQPPGENPVPADLPEVAVTFQPQQDQVPGGIGSSFSVGWAEPSTNLIDLNAIGGLTATGMIPGRPIDVFCAGASYAHLSGEASLHDHYELAIVALYRFRVSQALSIKPEVDYIIHPFGAGASNQPIREDALLVQLRAEMSF
jgi:carbohydrate-selective porin OprB